MVQQVFTVSDQRVKTDVTLSNPKADLHTLLSIPVHRYSLVGKKTDHKIVGFIAQEVEKTAPFAVKCVTNAIPSILLYGTLATESVINLYENDMVIEVGSKIKLVFKNVDYIRTVVLSCHQNQVIALDEPISYGRCSEAERTIFIYGHVVSDFKLIDTDQLMPLVFNSVKALNSKLCSQQQKINTMMERLDSLESILVSSRDHIVML